LQVADFDFQLPKQLIAQEPAEPRDAARLLVCNRQNEHIEHRIFAELDQLLSANDVLVLNQTRVEPRRLFGHKRETGGKVEILLLEKREDSNWECKVSPGLKIGQVVEIKRQRQTSGRLPSLCAVVVCTNQEGNYLIEFTHPIEKYWQDFGCLPIPPYIKDYQGDPELYQTIYANADGSVAAPTAGRHFTDALFERLKQKGVQIEYLTLHVSRDTAFPIIKQDKVEDVTLHSEWVEITPEVAQRLNQAKQAGKRIIAMGTTSVRSLEGVARISAKCKANSVKQGSANLIVESEKQDNASAEIDESCHSTADCHSRAGGNLANKLCTRFDTSDQTGVLQVDCLDGDQGFLIGYRGPVDLFIYPGFEFGVIDGMITNFHFPRSTLIMLVSAFLGKDKTLQVYQEAVRQQYRFFSFGDAMLVR